MASVTIYYKERHILYAASVLVIAGVLLFILYFIGVDNGTSQCLENLQALASRCGYYEAFQ